MTGLGCADVSRLAGGGQCRRCQGRPLYSLFIGCEDRENSHNSQVRAAYAMWLPRMLDLRVRFPAEAHSFVALVCNVKLSLICTVQVALREYCQGSLLSRPGCTTWSPDGFNDQCILDT